MDRPLCILGRGESERGGSFCERERRKRGKGYAYCNGPLVARRNPKYQGKEVLDYAKS